LLRHRADLRSLAYLAVAVALTVIQWRLGEIHPVLYTLSFFMSLSTSIISHNHNHLGMWKSRVANLITSYVITMYYGHPAIAWVPTHNQVHHKLNNAEGDSSRSPKWFKNNHLPALLIYPTVTGIVQTKEIRAFFKDLYGKNRRAFWEGISQYIVFGVVMAGLFWLDWRKTLLFVLIPQQFAQFMIQVFNYVQHVETHTGSDWNHSRNFVSPVLNALLFNNGYHTVHHMKPGVHWADTPPLHAEHASNIDSTLLVKSWWWFMLWTFFLRPLVPGARAPTWGSTHEGAPADAAGSQATLQRAG
jgi:beta-carotene hydroxylase